MVFAGQIMEKKITIVKGEGERKQYIFFLDYIYMVNISYMLADLI